jgi:hypothetical protein
LNRIAVAIAAALALAAFPAQAQESASGVHTHDGFYLNLDLGLGYEQTKIDTDPEITFSGLAGQFSVAAGAALTPNFVLAGRLWGVSVFEPDVEVEGLGSGTAEDVTLSLNGIGVDLTYYFQPVNVYVTVTPSLVRATLDDGNSSGSSDYGFGARFAVGKEWWVSDNWGIGLNAQAAFASPEDEGVKLPSAWFGVGFSATFD